MENEQINNILSLFENNPILNVATLILAIVGIVFTVYFYFRSRKVKAPIYITKTTSLVKESINKVESVQILYANNKIANLSVTKIAFWNDGKDTINNTDVAKNDILKIVINPNFDILEAKILYNKNKSNDFQLILSEDRKYITINFDFFDFEEGIVLQLFHTANSGEDITVTGTIKSVKEIKRKEYFLTILPSFFYKTLNSHLSPKLNKNIMGWLLLLTGILMTVLPYILSEIKIIEPQVHKDIPWYFSFLISLPGILYAWLGYRLVKRTIPKGFNIFNE